MITIVFMLITAAVLAEICSALPLSGSIYIWAAESAGPKYARFFGFLVAWWSCTAWMTFTASNCQACQLSLLCRLKLTKLRCRPPRTTLSRSWLFGRLTFLAALATIMSNGEHLFGPYPRVYFCCRLLSIIFLRSGTPISLNFPSA